MSNTDGNAYAVFIQLAYDREVVTTLVGVAATEEIAKGVVEQLEDAAEKLEEAYDRQHDDVEDEDRLEYEEFMEIVKSYEPLFADQALDVAYGSVYIHYEPIRFVSEMPKENDNE